MHKVLIAARATFIALFVGILSIAAPADAGWFDPPKPTADGAASKQLENLQKQGQRVAGMPNIVNFFERQMVKMLYELRDNPEFMTTTYIVTMNGTLVKICDSVGFGINASIQIANPEKAVDLEKAAGVSWSNHRGLGTIPQMEPNALFMPEGLAATYVMCVDEKADSLKPVYLEPEIIVSPISLDHLTK